MIEAVDSFRISLKLYSFQCDPIKITKALGITPTAVIRKGQDMGAIVAGRSSWFGKFREGLGNEAFGKALEDLLASLELSRDFIDPLLAEGGELIVVLSQTVAIDDGILFSLKLEPFFLHACGMHGVGLEVEAWSSEEKPVRSPDTECESGSTAIATPLRAAKETLK
jgi:uncharacterized protein DUF4279